MYSIALPCCELCPVIWLLTFSEDCIQELPKGTIRWQLLWLIMSAGTEIETQDDLTGEMVSFQRVSLTADW